LRLSVRKSQRTVRLGFSNHNGFRGKAFAWQFNLWACEDFSHDEEAG
jgi:hypothetical protein